MKRLLITMVAVAATLLATAATQAKQVELLVIDSANALLPDVQVKIGKTTYTTKWDGRVVLSDKELGKVKLSADGYYDQTVRLSRSALGTTQLVTLKAKPRKAREPYVGAVHKGSLRTTAAKGVPEAVDVMYMRSYAAVEAESVMADEAYAPKVMNSAQISAGKLTAGEVNDFAKWELWPKILNESHRAFLQHWGITARHRYVAQVTTKAGFPVLGYAVSLLDNKGNTLFQTRTDNTGRAELWSGLFGNEKMECYLEVDGQKTAAKPWKDGINGFELDMVCEAPETADVFFIFDATGSMGDELHYLQAEMKDVIARSQSAVEGLKIRTGALVYRDHGDEYLTRISRLSDDISETQQFIDRQHANGGGDFPEAVPEALMASINCAGWNESARARIAFLVLDAPCHQDSASLSLLHEQLLNAAAQGIRLVPVVCSGLDKSGELLMRSVALATNGTSFFLTDDSGIGNTHLKPTTDSLKVEHLNDMLVRTIISFCRMPECVVEQWADEAVAPTDEEQFLPNPFSVDDLDSVPAILPTQPLEAVLQVRPNPCSDFCLVNLPMGADALYLGDLSGKTVASLGSYPETTTDLQVSVAGLSTGIYFVKAFVGGRWYTQKLIVK